MQSYLVINWPSHATLICRVTYKSRSPGPMPVGPNLDMCASPIASDRAKRASHYACMGPQKSQLVLNVPLQMSIECLNLRSGGEISGTEIASPGALDLFSRPGS